MQSHTFNVRYTGGFSATIIIFIVAIVLAVAGFFYYRGALNQERALESEIPSFPPPVPPVPEANMISPTGEIGAEDEMVQVPEGDAGSETEGVIEARPLREFTIAGKNFSFSEKEIRVKKGEFVRINFKSTDGFHDWVVDAFDAKTDRVTTGESSSVDFVADKAGTFEFYCSVGNHRQMGMTGKLLVE